MENMTNRADTEATMNEIIMTYNTGIETVKNYIDSASSKKIRLAPDEDERTVNAINLEKQRSKVYELSSKTTEKVKEIINTYNTSEAAFFSLNGSDITSDIDLLKLDLSETQIKELQERYKNNYTMLSSINQYATNKGYPLLELQKNRTDILDSFNKLIYPRYTENISIPQQKLSFTFLDSAEAYKTNFLRQIF